MIANKLKRGDEVRVIAPSRNLTEVRQDVHHHAVDFWAREGFNLTFSQNSREVGKFHSSNISSRVEDIHEAFLNPNVKMIITCLGGFNANQLLRYLDYDLIAKHPKILCGFSDITALHNAIYAKTGLITYHGPHYGTFTFDREAEYTRKAFFDCVMNENSIVTTPSEAAVKYHAIQEGTCEGTIIGGNLCTLNLLQGTPSVIRGIITYIWVVVPMKGYSAIAGSVALFIMMLPLIVRSTEETMKILPASLKEAGLALGGNNARVILKVQLPAAFGGIFTGVLLAVSRVIGETAPLMFTALGCSMIRFSIDKPISAVPLLIWEFFNDPNLQSLIWGASLFLLLFVLFLNLTAKKIANKWNS